MMMMADYGDAMLTLVFAASAVVCVCNNGCWNFCCCCCGSFLLELLANVEHRPGDAGAARQIVDLVDQIELGLGGELPDAGRLSSESSSHSSVGVVALERVAVVVLVHALDDVDDGRRVHAHPVRGRTAAARRT